MPQQLKKMQILPSNIEAIFYNFHQYSPKEAWQEIHRIKL